MNELVLEGCRPVPLAHYLKALGVLRLVAEQADAAACGCWERDRFVLHTELDRRGLEQYFLEKYVPSPIVGPWNGGSGFYPKDNKDALESILTSTTERFADYRETIGAARALLARLRFDEKVTGGDKAILLEGCRGSFPDHSLAWLDATYLLSENGPKFPPLLGTGGNDGRLDFTNNFMQHLVTLFDMSTGCATSIAATLLQSALFDVTAKGLVKDAPIGQFLPGHAGGANANAGFAGKSLINPWDFILMLEGAMAFAATTARRTERDTSGALSYPFTVRSTSVGFPSAAAADEPSSRAEMWLPIWSRPAGAIEIQALFAEGRARVGGRPVRNGVDFARAVAGLGVDRGIDMFQRYGFHVRNGLSYFAVPIGRFDVHAEPKAALLKEIDSWLDGFRRRATGQNAPAAAARALRQLESSILELCIRGDAARAQNVLVALGCCEQVLAMSSRWTAETFLSPVPALSPAWLRECDDGSIEFRLAAAVASVGGRYRSVERKPTFMPLRYQLEPVSTWISDNVLQVRWNFDAANDVAWTPGHLTDSLNAVIHRRLILAVKSGAPTYPDFGRLWADLGDIADFIDGSVDDSRVAKLLWGCALVDWSRVTPDHHPARRAAPRPPLGALYALLKLCFPDEQGGSHPAMVLERGAGRPSRASASIPIEPRIHRAAAAGDGVGAAREAIRRLRGSGFAPAISAVGTRGQAVRRTAAALIFPTGDRDRKHLAGLVLRPESDLESQPLAESQP